MSTYPVSSRSDTTAPTQLGIYETLVPDPIDIGDNVLLPFSPRWLCEQLKCYDWLEPFKGSCEGCEKHGANIYSCPKLQLRLSVRVVDEMKRTIEPPTFSGHLDDFENLRVVGHGVQRGLLGVALPFYKVKNHLTKSQKLTVYPFLGEVWDLTSRLLDPPANLDWYSIDSLRSCLVAERVLQQDGTFMPEWSPATIVSEWEDWPLLVEFCPGYPAFDKHGGNRVRALWAVPNTPQAREVLQAHGQNVASTAWTPTQMDMPTQMDIPEPLVPHPLLFWDSMTFLPSGFHPMDISELNEKLSNITWRQQLQIAPGGCEGCDIPYDEMPACDAAHSMIEAEQQKDEDFEKHSKVVSHGIQQGLLGLKLSFYSVSQHDNTDHIRMEYPFLEGKQDEIFYAASGEMQKIISLRMCLVAEAITEHTEGTTRIEWTPAVIVSAWHEYPLVVRFKEGYAAFIKHGSANVKAFWAVPNVHEARSTLKTFGHSIAKSR